MSDRANLQYSPYRVFDREEWARLRADTPMTLKESELEQLSGLIEELSVEEVEQIYLPMSRLLNLYVAAAQQLDSVSSKFLGRSDGKVPFIIGVGGSVAVGKSTTARVLKALLARWPDHPRVEMLTTDGFLWPNAELERRQIMDRKGFPESFDTARLLNFLANVKSGVKRVEAPVYSHFHYDILPDQKVVIESPDILIVEGLNVLQPGRDERCKKSPEHAAEDHSEVTEEEHAHEGEEHEVEEHYHHHHAGDPHFWLDPTRGRGANASAMLRKAWFSILRRLCSRVRSTRSLISSPSNGFWM
jgi:type I pantothenate kinase